MQLAEIFKIILLVALVVCAVAVNVTKGLLQSVVIFMAYSSVMALLWILMESPDLAITEAAVGAGLSTILFILTLRKLRKVDEQLIGEEGEAESES